MSVKSRKAKVQRLIGARHKAYHAFERAAKAVKVARKQLLAAKARAKALARRGPTVMFDATTIENIPLDAPAVAGYVAGNYPTFPHLVARHPHAKRLSIAVASTQDAECLDVEPGDSRPELVPAWVRRQHARGVKRPVIYSSVSEMPAVLRALRDAGIPRSSVRLWTAHYTFHEHLCDSRCGFGFNDKADATQWTDRARGRSLDQSVLRRNFF